MVENDHCRALEIILTKVSLIEIQYVGISDILNLMARLFESDFDRFNQNLLEFLDDIQ